MTLAYEDAEFTQTPHANVKFNCSICQSCYMYLLKFPHGFVKVVTCIFRPLLNKPSYSLTKILNSDLSKLLHGFFKINTLTSLLTSHGFVKVLYFSSFAKQHQVWPRVQSLLKLLLRPKVVEWVKVLNALGPLCI